MLSFLKKKTTNGLKYETKLIKKFHKDHEKLIKLLTKIATAVEKSEDKKVRALLSQFKVEILSHFMEEDIKLYRYLKKYYEENEEKKATIMLFQDGIKTIQSDIINFLDSYIKEDKEFDKVFQDRFKDIINAFGERIKTEESKLYPLYIR